VTVRADDLGQAISPRSSRIAALHDERSERTSWLALVFVTTIVFWLIDHHLYVSVDTIVDDLSNAPLVASEVASGKLRRQLAFAVFGLYGLIALIQPSRFRLRVRGPVAVLLLVFLLWCALSLSWSLSPSLTTRRLFALGFMALGTAGLLRQFSGAGILQLFFFMTLSYLLVGICVELALGVFQPWLPWYRFAGTLHPNFQGANCAALMFAALTLSITSKHRRMLLVVAAGALGFLLLTGSRGALFAAMAGMVAFWLLKTRRSLAAVTVSVLGCVAVLVTFLVVNGVVPSPRTLFLVERTEGVGVLTGRPDLWAILLEYARERPLLGYGYGAFFEPERGLDMANRIGTWAFGGPHSVYLGALVDIGAVGLVCLVGVLLGVLLRSVRAYRHTLQPHFLFFATLLVFQFANGFTESQLLTPNPWFIPSLTVAFLAFRSEIELGRRAHPRTKIRVPHRGTRSHPLVVPASPGTDD
jgi:exopolysaccharide production protein ExoQ